MKIRVRLFSGSVGRVLLAVALVAALLALPVWTARPVAAATQVDIIGPLGSGSFGTAVTALPNGNIVVTDPGYDDGTTAGVGAVYLVDGATGALISTLTGSTAGDGVGSGGVTALSNGNYVVRSPGWDNVISPGNQAVDAGAVTWGSGLMGVAGPIAAENSVRGAAAGGGAAMMWAYDYANRQLVVGRPVDNIVTLFRLPLVNPVFLPVVLRSGP